MYNYHMNATHYDASVGLDLRTACGTSLHGWSMNRPQSVTTVKHEVTCKRCLKKI